MLHVKIVQHSNVLLTGLYCISHLLFSPSKILSSTAPPPWVSMHVSWGTITPLNPEYFTFGNVLCQTKFPKEQWDQELNLNNCGVWTHAEQCWSDCRTTESRSVETLQVHSLRWKSTFTLSIHELSLVRSADWFQLWAPKGSQSWNQHTLTNNHMLILLTAFLIFPAVICWAAAAQLSVWWRFDFLCLQVETQKLIKTTSPKKTEVRGATNICSVRWKIKYEPLWCGNKPTSINTQWSSSVDSTHVQLYIHILICHKHSRFTS